MAIVNTDKMESGQKRLLPVPKPYDTVALWSSAEQSPASPKLRREFTGAVLVRHKAANEDWR